MNLGLLAQYIMNGLMLGMMYALVAVGFTLFYGVLDVIKFSHGDVLAVGAFASLGAATAVTAIGGMPPILGLLAGVAAGLAMGAVVGAGIGRALVLPLRSAPPVHILLATLMAGTALREAIRLLVPNGGNPKPFPSLLPTANITFGAFSVGRDSILILLAGIAVVAATHLVITRTRLGLAIRAVAQDEDAARLAGINFNRVVLGTFAIGSALAAFAGCMIGLYYREVTFNMGILLGVIGFAAAVVGGLGSLLGAMLGGLLFAGVQTLATIALPFSSAYKDVVAFGVMICLIAVFPTGLIPEKSSDRV
jgi:branched-chain amino acid transport system permease protein